MGLEISKALAIGTHTSTLVGRRTVAVAAARRDGTIEKGQEAQLPALSLSLLFVTPSSGVPLSYQLHGHFASANAVRVVSSEFESVRVEQNQFHGLATDVIRATVANKPASVLA